MGSDDFEIRIFRSEEVVSEITESDRVTTLQPVRRNVFAYSLGNRCLPVVLNLIGRACMIDAVLLFISFCLS